MLVAVNRLMRAEGVAGPDLLGLLDLVALATVADVAPLVGLNRALVRQGLAVMARRRAAGHRGAGRGGGADRRRRAPTGSASCSGRGSTPAGGSARPTSGARLLATDDPHEAAALAERLHGLNAERREIEAAVRARGRGAGGGARPTGRWSGRPARAGTRASSASSRRG